MSGAPHVRHCGAGASRGDAAAAGWDRGPGFGAMAMAPQSALGCWRAQGQGGGAGVLLAIAAVAGQRNWLDRASRSARPLSRRAS
jgi:hypothetical protein